MSTIQSLTAQINDVLDTGRAAGPAELERLASEYARLSANVNQRLRRCLDFLRKGLRSEAIQHAETDPELFGLIQSLDLRRIDLWDRICREHNLERPRPLLMEVTKALNEVYAIERKLTPLLRRHRALAIQRAPLRERIDVLRRLAEVDPRNPVWEMDLRAMESARLPQIVDALRTPDLEADRQRCEAILAELTDVSRRIRPDPALLNAAHDLVGRARRRSAEEQCRRLLPRLHEAQSAWDFDQCHALLQSWQHTLAAAGLSLNDLSADIQEQWRPIGAWFDAQQRQREEQQNFVAGARELREAMQSGARLAQLEQLHQALVRFDRPIDEDLQRDYQNLVATLRLAHERRRRIRLGVVAGVVVAVALLGALLASDLLAARAAERRADDITLALADGDVPRAQDHHQAMAGWRPFLLGVSGWRKTYDEAAQSIAAEQNRQIQLTTLMQQVKALGPAGVTDALITAADELARTADERLVIADVRAEVEAHRAEVQRQRDETARTRLAALSETLRSIDLAAIEEDPTAFSRQLTRLETELATIVAQAQGREPVLAAARPLEVQLQNLRAATERAADTRERSRRAAQSLQRLPDEAHTAAALTEALNRFVATHPESPFAVPFARAAEFAPAWAAVEAWNSLLADWAGRLQPADFTDAARRHAAVRNYLSAHPQSPIRPQVQAYGDHLAQVTMLSSAGGWQRRVRSLMEMPVLSQLNYLQTRDDARKRYYTPFEPNHQRIRVTSLGLHVPIARGTDLSDLEEVTFSPPGSVTAVARSPQRDLADQVMRTLRTVDAANAAALPIRILEQVRQAEAVDPIVRALVIRQLVNRDDRDLAPQLARDLADWVQPLLAVEVTHLKWIDPDDAEANRLRPEVARVLASMPPLEPMAERVRAANAQNLQALQIPLAGTGVLLVADGKRVARPSGQLRPGARHVLAVIRQPGRQTTTLEPVGTVEAGQVSLDDQSIVGLPLGSMLFFTP